VSQQFPGAVVRSELTLMMTEWVSGKAVPVAYLSSSLSASLPTPRVKPGRAQASPAAASRSRAAAPAPPRARLRPPGSAGADSFRERRLDVHDGFVSLACAPTC
jgi:hypothetical protein